MLRKPIEAVCTMATRECAKELALFHRTLRTFHPTIPLFLGCTAELRDAASPSLAVELSALHTDNYVHWVPCLDAYGPAISRAAMEQARGVWYATRHTDFMMEKANLMELAMRTTPVGTAAAASSSPACPVVAFLDCDLTLLRGLPTIPATAAVALSAHAIRQADEALFGRFNGGYVVASTPEVLWEWRRATATSRYFDQASLEHVAAVFEQRDQLHCLPLQHNYGFWRLLQPQRGNAVDEAARFTIAPYPAPTSAHASPLAILYDEQPLCSLHTHFCMFGENVPRDVRLFNDLLRRWISTCVADGGDYERNDAYVEALSAIIDQSNPVM